MKLLFSLEQTSKIFPRLRQKLSSPKVSPLVTSSQYGKKLVEWRKIRSFYGKLSQKYLQSLYQKTAFCSQNSTSFFCTLESRLDVILYRAYFFESIATAKQQIRNGAIQVNNLKVISPSYNLLPGDVISVLPKSILSLDLHRKYFPFWEAENREDDKLSSSVRSPIKEKLYKKKRGWRFRRSPFFVSLLSNSYPFQMKKNAFNLKSVWLSPSFLTRLCTVTFKEFKVADALRSSPEAPITFASSSYEAPSGASFGVALPEGRCASSGKVLQGGKTPIGLKEKSLSFNSKNNVEKESKLNHPSLALYKSSNDLEKCDSLKNKESFQIGDWLFSCFILFLKKQSLASRKKPSAPFLPGATTRPLPLSIYKGKRDGNDPIEVPLYERKEALHTDRGEKNQLFFKKQRFLLNKRTKPLHLEISYRSLSIIFLFPPQRICFPFSINLSQIYK